MTKDTTHTHERKNDAPLHQAGFRQDLQRYEREQARHAEREEFDRAEALQLVIDQVGPKRAMPSG